MDKFTKTTSTSWFGRMGDSIKGIFLGILMFFGAIVLLWWNEGRAVKTAKGLEEGAENVVSLATPVLENKNDQKLIHFHGEMFTDDSIGDQEFNITLNTIKFMRQVEMYQWKENTKTTTKKKVGGGEEKTTEYTYTKEWSSNLINSSKFEVKNGHENPADFPYSSFTDYAPTVALGDFIMTSEILSKVEDFVPLKLNEEQLQQVKGDLIKDANNDQPIDKIFIGKGSKSNPVIGDVKIAFYYVPSQEYSIIAQQSGGQLKPYNTETETSLLLVSPGNISAKEMFEAAQNANSALTWGLRVAGFFLMFFGITTMAKIVQTISDFIPILGNIVGLGIGVFAGVVSLLISSVIIGIAWLYYRPILGASLIIIGVAIVLFFYKKSLDKKSI